jgi:hypothetical protein
VTFKFRKSWIRKSLTERLCILLSGKIIPSRKPHGNAIKYYQTSKIKFGSSSTVKEHLKTFPTLRSKKICLNARSETPSNEKEVGLQECPLTVIDK